MTRRILAGFLGVLAAVIAAVVVPLGVLVTAQQRHDFRNEARTAARAVAALAEEKLDDRKPAAVNAALSRLGTGQDRIAVLDAAGRVIGVAGTPLPASVLTPARSGASVSDLPGTVVVTVPVGEPERIGTVVLARDAGPLEHRQGVLWTWLAAAAAGALLLGAGVGWALSRWISRPLHGLAAAAVGIGSGQTLARADPATGPPEVRQVAVTFNTMAARVAALVETQRSMTAEVSHQLRTPLAALRLRLELLAADLEPESRDEVAAILEETNRLSRMVDGLLAAARAEASPTTPRPVDLAAIAQERLTAWQPVADERGVSLRLDTAPATAVAGPGHVDQMLDNLLDNAIAAVPADAEVRISTCMADDCALLTVADTGPGMSAERRAHALDRYYTDRAGNGGTGLGLHVVARLATANSGTVALRETLGGGLTVEVRLPGN